MGCWLVVGVIGMCRIYWWCIVCMIDRWCRWCIILVRWLWLCIWMLNVSIVVLKLWFRQFMCLMLEWFCVMVVVSCVSMLVLFFIFIISEVLQLLEMVVFQLIGIQCLGDLCSLVRFGQFMWCIMMFLLVVWQFMILLLGIGWQQLVKVIMLCLLLLIRIFFCEWWCECGLLCSLVQVISVCVVWVGIQLFSVILVSSVFRCGKWCLVRNVFRCFFGSCFSDEFIVFSVWLSM